METKRILICIFIMALVTYVPRVLPLTVFRKQIKSRYIRSFLDYTPYAVLVSALVGTAVALVLSYFRRGLVTVACAAIAAVYVTEVFFL